MSKTRWLVPLVGLGIVAGFIGLSSGKKEEGAKPAPAISLPPAQPIATSPSAPVYVAPPAPVAPPVRTIQQNPSADAQEVATYLNWLRNFESNRHANSDPVIKPMASEQEMYQDIQRRQQYAEAFGLTPPPAACAELARNYQLALNKNVIAMQKVMQVVQVTMDQSRKGYLPSSRWKEQLTAAGQDNGQAEMMLANQELQRLLQNPEVKLPAFQVK